MKNLRLFLQFIILLLAVDSFSQTNELFVDLAATSENDEAIRGFATNDLLGRTVGVHGKSDATDGQGVWGEGRTGVFAQGGDFGIFASGTSRAGHFAGDLEYTGNLIGPMSDMRLKNILKSESSYLDLINKMTIKKFLYKTDEYPGLHLSHGVQYGVIAQELEKVLPSLVHISKKPTKLLDSKDQLSASMDYKTVNYVGLIPIAVASIQELSAKIHNQEEQIEALNKKIEILTHAVNLLKER